MSGFCFFPTDCGDPLKISEACRHPDCCL